VVAQVHVGQNVQYRKTLVELVSQAMNGNGGVTALEVSNPFSICGPIHISGIAEARAVKLCTLMGYITCYQKNEKSPPKGAWLWTGDLFKFLVPPTISLKRLKL